MQRGASLQRPCLPQLPLEGVSCLPFVHCCYLGLEARACSDLDSHSVISDPGHLYQVFFFLTSPSLDSFPLEIGVGGAHFLL